MLTNGQVRDKLLDVSPDGNVCAISLGQMPGKRLALYLLDLDSGQT